MIAWTRNEGTGGRGRLLLPLIFLASGGSSPRCCCCCSTAALSVPLLTDLAAHAVAHASAHGLQIERRVQSDAPAPAAGDGSSSSSVSNALSRYECAPISLLPNAYPRECFEKAQSLARPFNELVDLISRDGPFLTSTLENVNDPFTTKLLTLYKEIYITDAGDDSRFARSADRLGIQRSDYMLNDVPSSESNSNSNKQQKLQLKQVELNTIASSFAGLAVQVASMHRHLLGRYQREVSDFMKINQSIMSSSTNDDAPDASTATTTMTTMDNGVPDNPALKNLANAMNIAFKRYCSSSSTVPESSLSPSQRRKVLLMVVQEGETNTVDQRMLEFQLWDQHGIPVIRKSLSSLYRELRVSEIDGTLTLRRQGGQQQDGDNDDDGDDDDLEVAVVYFRAGYAPTDYPSDREWEARERLERSRATKCPCLGYHLAGTKKVQQALARPGTVERFLSSSPPDAENVRSAFAGLYSLGEDDAVEEDLEAVRRILQEDGQAGKYVLKPQREGGGYNFYGDDLEKKIRDNVEWNDQDGNGVLRLSPSLSEFILMERLFPPQQDAILLRSGRIEGIGASISELGCFGTIVSTASGEIVHNEYAGFLLRTKFASVDEGGVASGFATLSSPCLC